ncbi:MAG: hypothetical protein ACOVOL_06730 [Bacteroidia bacterium]|jgi:hypothetical protein
MKKVLPFFLSIAILIGCNEVSNKKSIDQSVDLCKCLTEPGNSEWALEHKDACRDAISKELGVDNYEKVNFSKDPELNRKWDQLVQKCTGSNEVKTGVEEIDRNSELVKEIGTAYGYIWESINIPEQLYTTLAFDGLVFRTTLYSMNGNSNSEDFTKVIDLSGKWKGIDKGSAEGVYSENNVSVSWEFSEDYSSLTNGKGVVFQRIKVK